MHIPKLLVSYIIFSLIVFFLYHTSLNATPYISLDQSKFPPTNIYTLKPIGPNLLTDIIKLKNTDVIPSIQYPTVQTAPSSPVYILVLIKEHLHFKDAKFDNLFFANKRIAEIQKWGNEMNINAELVSKGSIKDINEIIAKTNTTNSLLQNVLFYKQNNSWEFNLLRYRENILNYIHINKKEEDFTHTILKLKKNIDSNDLTIQNSIKNLNRTDVEKKYLLTIQSLISSELHTNINKELPEESLGSQHIMYPLSKIIDDKEYGTYNVYLNENFSQFLVDRSYNGELQNNPDIIPIIPDEPFLVTIKPTKYNNYFIFKTDFRNEIDNTSTNEFYWEKTLPMEIADSYLLELTSSKIYKDPVTLITSINPKNKNLKPVTVLKESLLLDTQTFQYKKVFETDPAKQDEIKITISSKEPLALDELQLHIIPIRLDHIRLFKSSSLKDYEPTIHLTEQNFSLFNTFLLEIKNTTSLEDRKILNQFGPLWQITHTDMSNNHYIVYASYIPTIIFSSLFIFLVILSITYLIISKWKKTLLQIRKNIYKLLIHKRNLLTPIFQKFKWLFIFATSLVILFDIAIYKSYSDILIVGTIMGVIIVSLSFKFKSTIYVYIGLIFLVITTFLYSIGQYNISYKTAMWAFLFFCIAVIYMIVIQLVKVVDKLRKNTK